MNFTKIYKNTEQKFILQPIIEWVKAEDKHFLMQKKLEKLLLGLSQKKIIIFNLLQTQQFQ